MSFSSSFNSSRCFFKYAFISLIISCIASEQLYGADEITSLAGGLVTAQDKKLLYASITLEMFTPLMSAAHCIPEVALVSVLP